MPQGKPPSNYWTDASRDSHDSAFMVAGAFNPEVLSDLCDCVAEAIAEGSSLEVFRADFNGWAHL